MKANLQTATLAGGCFWCLEAVFDELKGVESIESGYSGGQVANPSSHPWEPESRLHRWEYRAPRMSVDQ